MFSKSLGYIRLHNIAVHYSLSSCSVEENSSEVKRAGLLPFIGWREMHAIWYRTVNYCTVLYTAVLYSTLLDTQLSIGNKKQEENGRKEGGAWTSRGRQGAQLWLDILYRLEKATFVGAELVLENTVDRMVSIVRVIIQYTTFRN